MGKKPAYYAVQVGRETGVFNSWAECQAQVAGYSGAVFKKFDSPTAAQNFTAISNSNGGGHGEGNSISSSHGSGHGSYGGNTRHNEHWYPSSSSASRNSYTTCSQKDFSRSHRSDSYQTNNLTSSGSRSKKSSSPVHQISGFHTNSRQLYPTSENSKTSNPKKRSYYAVSNGKSTGIFNDWDSCKEQVTGYEGAKYKKFERLSDAEAFMNDNQPTTHRSSVFTMNEKPYQAATSKSETRQTRAARSQSSRHYYAVNFPDGSSKIFSNWDDCKAVIHGRRGVTFKKFNDYDSAVSFTKDKTPTPLTQAQRSSTVDEFLKHNSQAMLKKQIESEPKVVYTDGSYLPSGQAGFGVYFDEDDYRNISSPVYGGANDSYKPEVLALHYALRQVAGEIGQYTSGQIDYLPKYIISSDNEAAKNVLTKYADHWNKKDFMKRKEGPTLYQIAQDYQKIRNFYNDNAAIFGDHKFEIKWVKGHSGVIGNVKADHLARTGANASDPK